MFNFMRQGQVLVAGADEDALFEAAIEAGADDVQPVFDEEGQPTSDFKVRVEGGDGGRGRGW
jgi:transcriptional/translational regulatory protein YebC/TACO1